MPQQINKKIIFYISLVIILGTFNNKNLKNFDLPKINMVNIEGIESNDNEYLKIMNLIKLNNLLSIQKSQIKEILDSNNLIKELKNKEVLKNKKSLLVQGSLSDNKLIESLKSFSNTEKIISYSTELVNKKYSDLEKITKKYKTYVVFTSPSSFDSFIKFYDASKVNLVSIGNTTSSHITNLGFQTILTSKMQSYEGISESLIAFFNENKQYELSKN